jgi:hypothetical protein
MRGMYCAALEEFLMMWQRGNVSSTQIIGATLNIHLPQPKTKCFAGKEQSCG